MGLEEMKGSAKAFEAGRKGMNGGPVWDLFVASDLKSLDLTFCGYNRRRRVY